MSGELANPPTVSADALPTVQINGVVWSQTVVGNTVYVGGQFTNARPAGSPPGVNTVSRSNLLAYDIRTGVLINSWAPTVNGVIDVVTASPDGSRIYIGGSFTNVNGQTKNRIAALNPTTGAVIGAFAVTPDARVRAIAATSTTVYFGGLVTNVNGAARNRVAAVRASDGAVLPWAPVAAGGSVWALALSPDSSKVLVGGSFTTMNGSSDPGYGLAAIDATSGLSLPWVANATIRNGGPNSAVTSLRSDGESVYATGFVFGGGGNLEGTVKMSWSDGAIEWLEDCHGDTYSTFSNSEATYVVTHSHYCGNVPGAFHQTNPWSYSYGLAFSKAATQTLKQEYLGYPNWLGNPAPSMLAWFPSLANGTFTGQSQAGWSLSGNDDYVVVGGEFPRAGGVDQQGLTRFAKRSLAPNSVGPELSGSRSAPQVTSPAPGQALVTWQTNWDRDNANLTYTVMRNGNLITPAYTVTAESRFWDRPYLSFLDTNPTQDLLAGQSVRYRIFATDPLGNESRSDTVNVTLAESGTVDDYSRAVVSDGPMHFWRFNEDSGTTAADYTGRDNLTTTGAVTPGGSGALAGDRAITFPGSGGATAYDGTSAPGAFWFSVEAWFQTTTNRGGKIVGYGNAQTGASAAATNDRHIYMGNDGRLNFGVRANASNRIVTSPSAYNDGNWHHVVGTVGDNGMMLFVDGVKVTNRLDTRAGAAYDGFWRVGGDNLSGWGNRPTSDYFAGKIDDVAIYRTVINGTQVRKHFLASGRNVAGPALPTDPYGQDVYNDSPEVYWRLAETSGGLANDSSLNGNSGAYTNGPVRGGPSAIGLGSDRSTAFDGSNDIVTSNPASQGPTVFSSEIWFSTTTTSGGKLIGFGNSRLGTSTTYDRHLFMTNSGQLRFGVNPGTQKVIESPDSYNDGTWHHAVATQGTNGIRLYVDGALVANSMAVGSGNYVGYWRIGGDNLSGWASRPSSDYFQGALDEAAVYLRTLSAAEVVSHFNNAGGVVPNSPPVASFTFTSNDLTATFSSAGSSDSDGTIVSRSWDFGDGDTSTAANPSHTYAAEGTYPVTLTVTDDDGDSDSITQDVFVAPVPNVAPTAAFTWSPASLEVSFDSAGSVDPDGSIVSRTWDFGDGNTDVGVSPNHTYAAAGTYDVTLTVTDDDGGTGSVVHAVTTTNAPVEIASDAFGRTVANGWGSAATGGPWTLNGNANLFNVNGGSGAIAMNSPGAGPGATLGSVSATTTDATVKARVDKLANSGGVYVSLTSRAAGSNSYRAKVKIDPVGRVTVYLVRATPAETTLVSTLLPASTTYAVGEQLNIRLQAQGTSPTTLRTKVWEVGTTEPAAWQLTTTDNTAGFQGPGGFSLLTYLASGASNTPVIARFDDFVVSTIP